MMKRVAVMTDSVACLPPDMAAQNGIHVVPVRLTVDGRTFRDMADELPQSLIRSLQEAQQIDTTPWPPEFYFRAYEAASRTANAIVHIVAFSQFTSTISQARAGATMAQEAIPGLRIEVFDSATTTMAQGFIALAAARAAAKGNNVDGVLAEADRVRSAVASVFTLDSLHYLARTGRVTRLASWAGSLLHVMPVVGLAHGKERPIALTRSRPQATKRLLELVLAASAPGEPLHVAIMESGQPEQVEEFKHSIQERLHPAELLVVTVSPVTQVVVGPGLLGVAFYSGD
jgi:DegV family protein with EDD domain